MSKESCAVTFLKPNFLFSALPAFVLSTRTLSKAIFLALYLLALYAWPTLGWISAQDNASYEQVWIKNDPEDPKPTTMYRGTILDFNGQRLEIQIGEGSIKRTFDADRIQKIQPIYTAEHEVAQVAMKEGDFAKAFELLSVALSKESRPWVQREILALQAQVMLRDGQTTIAAQLFSKIVQSDEQTRFYHHIPLMWETKTLNASESELAESLISSDDESLALIGSSWLLVGSNRSQATEKLQELSTSIDARISHLASAQIWRTEVLTATTSDIDRWNSQIERMPHELRFGPLLVVGMAKARKAVADQTVDETVAELMRLPILYGIHYHEAAAGLYVSAKLLEAAGRNDEAKQVYLELMNDYRNSKSAADAVQSKLVQELLKVD